MAWRDNLRPGSFRGVPFQVPSHTKELGRRTEVHEYALTDEPWAEDLGRETRRWMLQAYVIGPDYMAARDALEAALEAEGPGVLIHPWRGSLTVSVEGRATVEESSAEGGLARFTIPFVEAGANLAPAAEADTAGEAAEAAEEAKVVAADLLPAGFSIEGLPAFVSQAAGDLLGQFTGALDGALAGLAPSISSLGNLRQLGGDLLAKANALIAAPASLAGRVIGLVGQIRALAGNPLAALPALRSLMGFGSTLAHVLGDTPSRKRQRANQAAFVALVRRTAAAEAVAAVSEATFTSYEQAAAIRDDLAAAIDVLALEAGDAGDDDAFLVLENLRAALIRDVGARGGSLARVFAYTPGQTEPAMVTAFRVYGDASRDLEIVARNGISHPGFVPGGRTLELLTPDGEVR
ncbi:MAG: hypothetical protein GC145_14350 [Caulobacter sp.]|nr:hypothetical protein [Caulobacter sp.]